MARGYHDAAYGTKQVITLPDTGALNGTRAAVTQLDSKFTFMHPCSVTDCNIYMVAGGTQANVSVLVGKSAAGTGTVSYFGTVALGTQATGNVVDGAVTATAFSTGDDVVLSVSAGTATTVPNGRVFLQVRETYEEDDS